MLVKLNSQYMYILCTTWKITKHHCHIKYNLYVTDNTTQANDPMLWANNAQ